MALKKQLCPKGGSLLWRHLQDHPLPRFLCEEILSLDDSRLLISRADVTHSSLQDPVIDHVTVELGGGFAPMFRHIDGTMSVAQMLAHLRNAGANEILCNSVKNGFYQLIQCGMLILKNE